MAEHEIVVRDYPSLIEALIARKNELSLSNEQLEHICGLTRGHVDKIFGPERSKGVGKWLLGILLEGLALELVPRVNLAAAKRVQSRWEGRNHKQVRARPPHPISAELLERAKQIIFFEHMRKASAALTPEDLSRFGRLGGIASGKARRQARRSNGHNGHAAEP
jgi:hypothetical protein